MIDGRLKIDVIRADARRDGQFELGGLGDPLGRQVGGPERLRNDDLRVGQLAVEGRARAILVRGHDQLVSEASRNLPQPEFAGDAAQQLARLEVNAFRRRQRLPVGITLQKREIIARVGFRVTIDGIVVEDANNLGHDVLRKFEVNGSSRALYSAWPRLTQFSEPRIGRGRAANPKRITKARKNDNTKVNKSNLGVRRLTFLLLFVFSFFRAFVIHLYARTACEARMCHLRPRGWSFLLGDGNPIQFIPRGADGPEIEAVRGNVEHDKECLSATIFAVKSA